MADPQAIRAAQQTLGQQLAAKRKAAGLVEQDLLNVRRTAAAASATSRPGASTSIGPSGRGRISSSILEASWCKSTTLPRRSVVLGNAAAATRREARRVFMQ